MNDDVLILRKGNCSSLSGRSELTYEYGYKNKTILFRITDNTGSGNFQGAWISLDAILKCLQEAKEPFSLSVFRALYSGGSTNNTGFLGAVIKKEGLIICEKRKYMRKDNKVFIAALNKLITNKSPAKKTSKTAAKEASRC